MKLKARMNHDQRFSLLVHGAAGPLMVDRGREREEGRGELNISTRPIVHKPVGESTTVTNPSLVQWDRSALSSFSLITRYLWRVALISRW